MPEGPPPTATAPMTVFDAASMIETLAEPSLAT